MGVVAKFGGSSVANSEQFKKVKDIVTSNPSRKVIVVSALGKKNPEDSKITDLLYLLHAHLKYNVSYTPVWEMITTRFNQVKEDLGDEAIEIIIPVINTGVVIAVKGCESYDEIKAQLEEGKETKGIVVVITGGQAASAEYRVITEEDLKK